MPYWTHSFTSSVYSPIHVSSLLFPLDGFVKLRSKREDWITKYRQKKTLLANQINQRFPSQRVYINDHLTPENKQLLAKLKIKCREIGYTFAWCRDAKIFARKASGEPVRRITCLEDVERLQ
ncbi:hypothetical protein J6590_021256 [Homalodisca vitripennis]|nr:hypothetical protein J6590_021256 [Homalodisca vitripennis]